MYCKLCGSKIDDDSIYCSFCGTKQTIIKKPFTIEEKPVQVTNELLQQDVSDNHNHTVENSKNHKYDLNYQKDSIATAVGIALLLISLVLTFIGPFSSDEPGSYLLEKLVITLIAIGVRIGCVVWVVNIAKRQNRETVGWGIFALLLPSITLIIIGQLKKLARPKSHVTNYTYGDIQEKPVFNIVRKVTREGIQLDIHSTLELGYAIGDRVFINNVPAPNGIYELGWRETIAVEGGIIKKL